MQTTQPPGDELARHVAAEIRATLGRLGVNQAELARRLGVSDQWVSTRIGASMSHREPYPIDLAELAQIAAALGVPVHTFLPAPEVTR